jgi:hypothetical protein
MTPTKTAEPTTDDVPGNGNGGHHPEAQALGDPTPPVAQPLILNDAYFELVGTNLRCLVKHLEIAPENKPVTITSFCAETDYPGVTKWHLRVTFHQSFDVGATYDTLEAAYTAYVASGAAAAFKARPYSSRVAAVNNPIISGLAIPQPFEIMMGDAGAAAEVQIDWNCTGAPSVDRGAVAATGAQAGAPGYFTPTGATTPANLAALTGLTATPATAWATGQYVITADLLANHWTGSAWAAGKA